MKIWSHTLIRNEERWVWYSVMSVIDYVDRVLLWDMSSTDNTYRICEEINKLYPDKISLKKIPKVNPEGFAKVRQEMLDETESDWFLVVDGDEIWWKTSIEKVVSAIRRKKHSIESIVVPLINVVGDIYHYQESSAGRYSIAGRIGHYSIRAISRKIEGLSSSKPHGTWGWTDGGGEMIQDRDKSKILFIDAPYIHTTHLQRSGSRNLDKAVIKREKKLKYELGTTFPMDYYYPEVFFKKRPEFVPSPWKPMDNNFYLRALVETPLRKIKRRLYKSKSGY